MSHFSLLVIGDDIDNQLAPFHEFECTGEDNEYVIDVDITDEVKHDYQEEKKKKSEFVKENFVEFAKSWHGCETVAFGTSPDKEGEHKFGFIQLDKKGEVEKIIRRTNPNKKWDWYQIGGRWTGYFKLKQQVAVLHRGILGNPGIQKLDPDYKSPTGEYADQCLKGDIDVEEMRNEAGEEAAKKYDLFVTVTDGLPKIISWEKILKKYKENVDLARKEYHAQLAIKALRDNKETTWFDFETFLCSRDEYIDRARKDAIASFALLKDGKWYERGEMGWWGIVRNEKDQWSDEFNKMFDALPDNTLVTVVDCHI